MSDAPLQPTQKRLLEERHERELELQALIDRQGREIDTLYETAPVGLGLVDRSLRWIRVNEKLAAINGVPVEAHLGRTLREVVGDALADRIEPLYRRVIDTGEPLIDYEFTGRVAARPDAERTWQVSYHPLRHEDGTVIGVNAAVQDVTERKSAEAERQRFATLIEQSSDCIGFAALDGQALYVNPATSTLLGLAGADRQLTMADLTAPDDRALLAHEILPQVMAGLVWKGELRIRHARTGDTIPTDQAIFPLVDTRTGAVEYIATIARDIRDRLEADRRLRRSESEFRALFEASAVCHAEADWPSGRILRINGRFCSLLGYSAEELLAGRSFAELTHPDDWPRTVTIVQEFLREQRDRFELEQRYLRKDGQVVWVQLVGTLLREHGDTAHLLCSAIDISERRRDEERLRLADRKKNEFLAILAHELRNPLAPIRTGLHVMRLAGADTAAVERAREIVTRQVEQMTYLIDELMDVSRISEGRIILKKSHMPLGDAIRNAVESAQPLFDTNGHQFTIELPSDELWVDGDLLRLSQVFTNLLSNAAKYTPRGGVIRLTAARDAEHAVVTVEDNGVGIPADRLSDIFEMFVQVDRLNDVSRGGLGLGLHIARRLVLKHGGTIAVDSGGPGLGSRFTVRLPALPIRGVVEPVRSAARQPAGVAMRPLRILVVDDNVDSGDALRTLLGLTGHETRTAHSGADAVALAESFRPHLVLMDIGMPGMNGYDACLRIRDAAWSPNMVIIAQTGWGQEEDRSRALSSGFDAHLAKPVDPAALMRVVADLSDKAGRG